MAETLKISVFTKYFNSVGEFTVFAREKLHFFDKNLPSKIEARLIHGILVFYD
jgi:hypothetical protein